MGKYFLFFLTISCFLHQIGICQSHGLQFSSHEVVPEKRTSLSLTSGESFCLKGDAGIGFDLTFTPNLETYFGYIVRLVTTNNQNIDIVYNQKLLNFNFVIGETFSGVFSLDSAQLFGSWNHFEIRFNAKSKEASFYLNNKFVCKGRANIGPETCYKVFFGANKFEGFQTVDVPPMRIKDIHIEESGKLTHNYPLWETAGNECMDIEGKTVGMVTNPVWIKPLHQNWQLVQAFETSGNASVAFDKKTEILYTISADTLFQLNLKNLRLVPIRLSKKHDSLVKGNQSIFSPVHNKLVNFYPDQQLVSTYDTAARRWDTGFAAGPLTVYWQANKFISPIDSCLYIVGGYGQLQYKNLVQRYHFASKKWDTVKLKGDFFMPRYMAALGINADSDIAYVLGGYGSNSGDQAISPHYNYELMAYSIKEDSFKSIYHFPKPERQFCFANSLVMLPGSNEFYALTYPNDRFNSALQLIKCSLDSPDYQLMASPIPYAFHDIESFSDLYYCPASQKLVAVTLYNSKQGITSVKVYTLDFPPNQLLPANTEIKQGLKAWWYILPVVLLVGAMLLLLVRRKKVQRGSANPVLPAELPKEEQPEQSLLRDVQVKQSDVGELPTTGAIYLFGQFEVFDKNGDEITRLFSPLLKELFLLIVSYTLKDGKGISWEHLYETLWHDKTVKDAKNNFSVNIVKLKGILEKVGESLISKESGKWKFEILNDSIQIDYQKYLALTSGKQPVADRGYTNQLLAIVNRGTYLKEIHYNWLDDIKADISGNVIDTLLDFMGTLDIQTESELLIKTARVVFQFDQLNEDALRYKCKSLIVLGKHRLAKDAYHKFAKEYKENYGQDFEKPFGEVIA